jgi:hypothetical protein
LVHLGGGGTLHIPGLKIEEPISLQTLQLLETLYFYINNTH